MQYLSVTGNRKTPIRAIYAPILSDGGQVTGTIGIADDITDQLVAEKEKQKFESHLRQAQKMEATGTLAGGIAHVFNNILSPMLGFSELLQDDLPQDSPLQDSVAEILTAGLRAKDLVKQILEFSRQWDHDIQSITI